MQALIDFDGWRKWKDFSQAPAQSTASGAKQPSPTAIKNAAHAAVVGGGGANGAAKGGERKTSLGLLTTGAPGKKVRRLGSDAGSGSEGSASGSAVAAGA